jgi:hypothetical protein
MEKSCYKCGQVMEEGRPFCPHCAAPQIRVLVAEPVAAPLAEMASHAEVTLPASQTVPVLALPVQWSQAWKPCALAAGIGTVLMFLGLTPAVAMFGVGFLSVMFYRQGHPGVRMKAAQGARLGAFGGLLCFGVMALLSAVAVTIPEVRSEAQQQIAENMQKLAAAHPGDPQIKAGLELMKTPEGLIVFLVATLVLFIVLGTLGGTLSGAIFGRRDPS